MPNLKANAKELRSLIEEWAKGKQLTSSTQQLVVKVDLEIVELVSTVIKLDLRSISAFENEWQVILANFRSETALAMLRTFIGRENQPLDKKDFPELDEMTGYGINQKLASFPYNELWPGEETWKIRRRGNIFTLETKST